MCVCMCVCERGGEKRDILHVGGKSVVGVINSYLKLTENDKN